MENLWVGIDISKDTFDAAYEKDGRKVHGKFDNRKSGFRALVKWAPAGARFAMEATGLYYLRCALFLSETGAHVSVENPLAVARFVQSELSRSKSDKADAFAIARYGRERNPVAWSVPPEESRRARQLLGLVDLEKSHAATLAHYLEALRQDDSSGEARRMCEAQMAASRRAAERAEKRLEEIVLGRWGEEVAEVASIPGVGVASACALVAKVGDFGRFKDSRSYMSWLGMTPRNRQSGTSVHVNGGITKMGDSRLRRRFYMCAVSAIRSNARCRAMRARMAAKGKPTKVALVAVECKLLRTAYALVTKGQKYDAAFNPPGRSGANRQNP